MLKLNKQIVGLCLLLCVGGSVEEVARRAESTDLSASGGNRRRTDPDYDEYGARKTLPAPKVTRDRFQLNSAVPQPRQEELPPPPPPPPQVPQYERIDENRIPIQSGSPTVTVTMNAVHGLIGSSNLTLECFIDSFPKATNFWMKGDQERLYPSSQKYNITEVAISPYEFRDRLRLQILNLDHQDLSGVFRCVSSNQYGASTGVIRVSAPDHISTQQFPIKGTLAVERGADFYMACKVDANPLAVTYWFKGKSGSGEQILNSDKYIITEQYLSPTQYFSRLQIKNFGGADYAVYRCVSKNRHGESQHFFHLSSSRAQLQAPTAMSSDNGGNSLIAFPYPIQFYLIICLFITATWFDIKYLSFVH